jgi:hypothetical protein
MANGGTTKDDAAALGAARSRVAAILELAAHIQIDVMVVAPPDGTRIDARERARDIAAAAGRSGLLDEAVAAARERVTRAFASAGYSGTWAVTDMAVSVARGPDRAAAAAALEEAVTAAVVEDLADPATLDVLTASWGGLAEGREMSAPGSLSNIGPAIASAPGVGAIVVAVIGVAVAATGSIALGIGLLAVGALLAWRAIAGTRGTDPGA